mmetsp:Transcript_74912/g.175731  ORF Transcript_74912/g.175731 Transcript_74912/m.175731 type:complete len:94 (-) Transcript_74912:639-920(-)
MTAVSGRRPEGPGEVYSHGLLPRPLREAANLLQNENLPEPLVHIWDCHLPILTSGSVSSYQQMAHAVVSQSLSCCWQRRETVALVPWMRRTCL